MQANIQNRTVFTGDCLDVMRGMDTQSVNLIYLDPPFNSKKQWEAPIGSTAEGASFKDYWTYDDVKQEWRVLIRDKHPALNAVIAAAGWSGGEPDRAYLCYMGVRLLEMHRILKNSGSIYYHCDPTMSHSIKLLMDAIFGADNFRNEIVWCYSSMGGAKKDFPRKHDILLRYSKTDRYVFNADSVRIPYKLPRMPERKNAPHRNRGGSGKWKGASPDELANRHASGKVPEDWWEMTFGPNAPERLGYPTQKPLALLERIIKASSSERNVVLDPFCGCGTACDAAEQLGRKWIGIDVSAKAATIIKKRLPLAKGDIDVRTNVPERTSVSEKFQLAAPMSDKEILYDKQHGMCLGCDIGFPIRNLQVDRNIPGKKGGEYIMENMQLLCQPCNASKGANRTLAELRAYNRKIGILPPLEGDD